MTYTTTFSNLPIEAKGFFYFDGSHEKLMMFQVGQVMMTSKGQRNIRDRRTRACIKNSMNVEET